MEPRNYLANAEATPPAAPGAPSTGYPRSATPGVEEATTPGPYWFYKIGESLRKIIVAAGLTPDDADLTLLQKSITPAGLTAAWPTATPPAGWLECDGAGISRTTYAYLFGIIGTTYGVGDGSTTFNIPDFRGESLRGWDHGAGIDPDAAGRTDRGDGTSGDNIGTKQLDALQNVTGSFVAASPATMNVSGAFTDGSGTTSDGASQGGTNDNVYNFDASNVARTSTETRTRNVNVMFCIKY